MSAATALKSLVKVEGLTVVGSDHSTTRPHWNADEDLDLSIDLNRVKAIHVNDSKGALSSHLDRHEHIGRGMLGRTTFRHIMRDRRFRDVPKILETPKGESGDKWDRRNLGVLRRMARE